MNQLGKYIIYSIVVVILFLYVLLNEVFGRFESTISQYEELQEKEKTVLSPEEFSHRKRELQIEKKELTTFAKKNYFSFQQNQGGLFEYLNTNAKKNNVSVRSIIPSEGKTIGSAKIILFTMNFSANFHDAAKFVNNIEMGTIPIMIKKSTIRSEPIGNSSLTVIIEGEARLLSDFQ